MGGEAYTFKLFGLTFNATNVISGTIIFVLVFFVLFGLSRHLQMKPKGGQNVIEWLIEFTNGIVREQMPASEVGNYSFLAFVLFAFIFFSNQLGLIFQIGWNGNEIVRSPTADPVVTLTFSLSMIMLAHFAGISKNGLKHYFGSYLKPYALGLRLFGNIFAGELLLKLLGQMAFSHGVPTILVSLPLEIVWQGFSVFIGAIQAYVFVTLTTVYISQKVSAEE